MKPEEYESLVASIATQLSRRADQSPPLEVLYGRTNLWQGDSSFQHQIDVSVTIGDRAYLFECKCWSSQVGTDAVLTFAARLCDIRGAYKGMVKGSLVTTVGWDPGVETLARYFEIGLDRVASATEFCLRVGDRVGVGFPEALPLFESVSAKVQRAPKTSSEDDSRSPD